MVHRNAIVMINIASVAAAHNQIELHMVYSYLLYFGCCLDEQQLM